MKPTPLQIKKAKQAQHEARLQAALIAARATAVQDSKKRKSADELAKFLAVPIHSYESVRDVRSYLVRSYNLERQIVALVDHVFVSYPVPRFLYRAILSKQGLDAVYGTKEGAAWPDESSYKTWFYAVAQGRSFARIAKETFTAREAHFFLKAPGSNTIRENILWARCAAAGLSDEASAFVVYRFAPVLGTQPSERTSDLIRFFVNSWDEMRGFDSTEIADFLLQAMANPSFSLKGRTLGSLRKLAEEWHRHSYSVRVRTFETWLPKFQLWEVREKRRLVRAIELTDNRALAHEGRVQRHCVFTYVRRCGLGLSRIISMRFFDAVGDLVDRITIEVDSKEGRVVQVRGRQNRRMTDEERVLVAKWSEENGCKTADWI